MKQQGPLNQKHIVILTGAGISAESGISTFRDSNGLWENHRIEDVATPEAFIKDPQLVWRFYSMRRIQAAQKKPNAAHFGLVDFAERFPDKVITLITQNVDHLHELADPVVRLPAIHMHGTLRRSRCNHCGTSYLDDHAYFDLAGNYAPQETALCTPAERASVEYLHQYKLEYRDFLPVSPCCKALLRPDIVWFGEIPQQMEKIQRQLSKAELFVSIGTSGVVYPAAGFLQMAKQNGAHTVCINMEPIPHEPWIDEFHQGKAAELVPAYFSGRR